MQLVKMCTPVARFALLCLIAGLSPAMLSAADELQYPFPAEVVEDAALVRSGAGTTYYVVKKLKKGDLVTVDHKIYQWYKIVPPPGVYSYVSKAFVDAKGDGKVGVVNKTPAQIFTASVNGVADSFRHTTNLLKGDTVEIVAEDGGYYKITPPKGTYVYIPASAVKQVQFKPAQAEEPVAVATPEAQPAPTPTPVVVAKPVDVTPKPFVAVTAKPEPITAPDPESTVITAPKPAVTAVVVSTPEPKPVAAPVVSVAEPVVAVQTPEVTQPKPAPTPVTISTDMPRPLVISKPQPGDELPITNTPEPSEVVQTPQVTQPVSTPTPATAVVASSSGRIIPPIPDTETPPSFDGVPSRAAEPVVRTSIALNTTMPDTSLPSNTQELVVDKPVVGDRLDGPAPSKPQLPVMADTAKPTPPMPSFPLVNPDTESKPTGLPAALPTLTPTAAPVASVVEATSSEPAAADTHRAIAPRPTVNPLQASRVHFQANAQSLSDLEEKMIDAHQLPLDKRPLESLLQSYQTLSSSQNLSIGDQRIVQARVAQLKRDINLSNALKSIGAVKTTQDLNMDFTPAQPVAVAQPAEPQAVKYDRVGQLMASRLYDGRNLPRLYRLVNPANPNVTLIYVRPNANVNAAEHMGEMVGINGVLQVDDALNLKILDPQIVERYQVQQ